MWSEAKESAEALSGQIDERLVAADREGMRKRDWLAQTIPPRQPIRVSAFG
jgi:hypothetical protein